MIDLYIRIISENPVVFYTLLAFLGLCAGSFFNVVAYRLPQILNRAWYAEACEITGIENTTNQEKLTLSHPCSSCTNCQSPIRWFQNLPIVSWVFLRGKCGSCKAKISIQYPAVELATCLLTVAVGYKFGFSLQALYGILFTWIVIPLAIIDFKEHILPDRLVFPLIGLGLLASTQEVFISPIQSIYGTLFGFLFLWIIFAIAKVITGKDGMGYGDFKILAAFGAWFGPDVILSIIIISSLGAIAYGIYQAKYLTKGAFGYGPYLIIAAWITFYFGKIV